MTVNYLTELINRLWAEYGSFRRYRYNADQGLDGVIEWQTEARVADDGERYWYQAQWLNQTLCLFRHNSWGGFAEVEEYIIEMVE